jgi:hypothetical protein
MRRRRGRRNGVRGDGGEKKGPKEMEEENEG